MAERLELTYSGWLRLLASELNWWPGSDPTALDSEEAPASQ